VVVELDTVLRRSTQVIYAPLDGEGVMLNVDLGRYHGVNQVGARIWDLLETPMTALQLRDRLIEEFEVEEQVCQRAVLDFVGKLLERGLVDAAS